MTEKKVAGYFYWYTTSTVPCCCRIPIDSGTPIGSYLAKFPLDQNEMDMALYILANRYPLDEKHEPT